MKSKPANRTTMAGRRLLLPLLLLSALAVSVPADSVHAISSPTLFIAPAKAALANTGSTVILNVNVTSMPSFDAWDIQVKADSTVINGTSISLTNSILSGASQLVNCINGAGTNCNPSAGDGMGVVHSAAFGLGTSASGNGILFTITYKAIAGPGSLVIIFNDHVSTPTGTDIPHTTVNGLYGLPLPDFTLSSRSASVELQQNKTASDVLNLTSLHLFSGTVNFTTTVSPLVANGPGTRLTRGNVTVVAGGSASVTLNVSTTVSTQIGSYNVNVTGSGVGPLGVVVSHFVIVSANVITVPKPDFGISANPVLLTIQPGSSKNSTITLTSMSGFTGSVGLVANATAGFMTVFAHNPVLLTAGALVESNLTVSVGPFVSPTTITLAVNATNGLIMHPTTIKIVVALQDFKISARPSSLQIETGSYASSNVTLTSQNGFAGKVLLAASPPAGVTLKFATNPLQLAAGSSNISNLTISVASTAPPTTVPIIVNGTNGLLVHQTTIVITITQPMSPTLSISPAKIVQATIGSTINLNVSVANMPTFNAWDILVKTDPTIINATSISLTNSVLTGGSLLVSCVNNNGTNCNPTAGDGMGVVHSAVFGLGTSASSNGILFTITYRVVGALVTGSGSPIVIFNDHVSTPAGSDILHTTKDGVYGTQSSTPDFELVASSTSLDVVRGSSNMTALSLTSLNGFAGTVNLTLTISPTIHTGLTALLTKPNVTLTLSSSGSTTLKIATTNSTQAVTYTVTVTGSSGSISHPVSISISVALQPFFDVNPSPSRLLVHAGQFGNSIITLTSENLFSGNITLTVASPQGVDITLNTTTLMLRAGRQVEVAVTISVPPSKFAFLYTINITASSGTLSPVVKQIIVQPPPGTFSTSVGSGSITVQAGQSANSTIIISSMDYLLSFVYFSAEMSGGAATLSTTRVLLLPSGTANTTVSVAITGNTVPGHYLLLLTIYQLGSQTEGIPPQTATVPITILVTGVLHSGSLSSPNLILGLSPPVYFGILGVLAAILGVLSVQTYRKSRED